MNINGNGSHSTGAPLVPSSPFERALSAAGAPAGLSDGGPRRTPALRLLWHFKWTVLLAFAVVCGVGLTALWSLLVPQYRATSVIQVRSQIPRLISRTEETGPIPQYQQYLQSQVAIIKSTRVLERALDRVDVQATRWYADGPGGLLRLLGGAPPALVRLSDTITAAALPGTELIEVAAVGPHAQDVPVLANAVVKEFVEFVNTRFSEEDRGRIDALTREREDLLAERGFLARKLADGRLDLQTGAPDELIAQRRIRLDQLEGELADLGLEISVGEEQLAQLEGAATQPTTAGSTLYAADPEWRMRREAVQALEQKIAAAHQRFGPRSEVIQQYEAELAGARGRQSEREAQLDQAGGALAAGPLPRGGDETALTPGALRHRLQLLRIRRGYMERYVQELRTSFEGEFNTAVELDRTKERLDETDEKLRTVSRRLDELNEKQLLPTSSIFPIAPAVVPQQPYRDPRVKYSIGVVFLGAATGLALAYLRLAYSPQVQELAEMRREVHGTFLGHLPLRREQDPAVLERCPLHAECVRMIRTALLHRLQATGKSVVQITSATLGSGKSTLSALLGRSLAQLEKRVLLVDADVRRPSLARRFGLPVAPGLIEALADGDGAARIRSTGVPGLYLLPAGVPARAEDYELLANGRFAAQLARWRQEYDLVLIDGAPLLGTADAGILARHADGTILVVRERHCRREALVQALSLLSVSGGQLLGTVFVGSIATGSYGYGYGYGAGTADLPALSTGTAPTTYELDARRNN